MGKVAAKNSRAEAYAIVAAAAVSNQQARNPTVSLNRWHSCAATKCYYCNGLVVQGRSGCRKITAAAPSPHVAADCRVAGCLKEPAASTVRTPDTAE